MSKVNHRRKAPRPPDILRKGHAHTPKNKETIELCHVCRGEGLDDHGQDCAHCGGSGCEYA